MKNKLENKILNFPLIIIGCLFLFNPVFSMLDIFPDFIGFLLLFAAFSKISKLNEDLASSQKKTLYLALLSFIRLICAVIFNNSLMSTKLLMCFSFGIVEFMLFFIWYREFFDGLEYLMLRSADGTPISYINGFRTYSLLFFIVKIALNILPETISLLQDAAHNDFEMSDLFGQLLMQQNIIIAFFAFISLVAGIIWIYNCVKFFRRLCSDRIFSKTIFDKLTEKDYFSADYKYLSRSNVSFVLFVIGMVFYFNVFIDKYPVLPEAAGTIIFFVGILLIKKFSDFKRSLILLLPAAAAQIAFSYFTLYKVNIHLEYMDNVPISEVVFAAAAALVYSFITLLFLHFFEQDIAKLGEKIQGVNIKSDFVISIAATVLICAGRIVGAALPTLYGSLAFFIFILSCVRLFAFAKIIFNIKATNKNNMKYNK